MGKNKTKTLYICQSCGSTSLKWAGQCGGCGAWNTLVEELVSSHELKSSNWAGEHQGKPLPLTEIDAVTEQRMHTPDAELNRVLGGGIVKGSVVLIAGEPGVGKSTLLLQLALQLNSQTVLYVSGEESAAQIKLRAERFSQTNDQLYIAAETQLENVVGAFRKLQPGLVIIDSIQTIYTDMLDSAPGSVSQVRESAAKLIRLAKENQIPIFIVGHITKEGTIAGPKVLEHMVDTVLSFEGDKHNSYRIVRTSKNRYGSTMELGIYEMQASGLREVPNPSEVFLSGLDASFSGVTIGATMEGMRPLLIETQALVSPMAYGTAQRSATGFDLRRLNMLLAVLEKRCGFKMGIKDVFINITGGLKIEDPALDLALICAVVSSLHDLSILKGTVFAAEVGLSGEIRSVNRLEARIAEAEKLGFNRIFVAANQAESLTKTYKQIEVRGVARLDEVFRQIFDKSQQ